MAAPIATGSTEATTMFALTSLEEQFVFLAQQLVRTQAVYNAANTTAPKTAIQVIPEYNAGTISLNAVFPLDIDAVTSFDASKVSPVFV